VTVGARILWHLLLYAAVWIAMLPAAGFAAHGAWLLLRVGWQAWPALGPAAW
jgi:hypothetical protein